MVVNIPYNYREYLRTPFRTESGRIRLRLSFRGKHNRRKTLILYSLLKKPNSTAVDIWNITGDCSLSCVRSTLSRMFKYNYISASYYEGSPTCYYSVRAKGERFYWAASQFAPLARWIKEAQETAKARA